MYTVQTLIFSLACIPFLSASVSVREEIKTMYDYFSDAVAQEEAGALKVYTERDKVASELQKKLLNMHGETSSLRNFPDLDQKTYNTAIRILADEFFKRKTAKDDALLHVWSFLTGIKVVGLKHDAKYYQQNMHLKKLSGFQNLSDVVLSFTFEEIFARIRNDESSRKVLPVRIPAEFRLRSAYYRSHKGENDLIDHVEWPSMTWEFLQDELAVLERFVNKNDPSSSPTRVLLTRLLLLNSKNSPLYSHGIVTLLRNTALYLSEKIVDSSRLLSGPFSIVTTSNFGLQDGIFLENRAHLADDIDYLIGSELFGRLFFRSERERMWAYDSKGSKEPMKTKMVSTVPSQKDSIKGPISVCYVPHYRFFTIDHETISAIIAKGVDRFSTKFRNYIKAGGTIAGGGNHGNYNKPYDVLPALIEELESKQLNIRLISENELAQAVSVVWFKPVYVVDISAEVMKKIFGNTVTDTSLAKCLRPREGETLLPVSALMLHLTCYPYRFIEKLIIADSSIADEGAREIAQGFAKGILPHLAVLDLSNNRITNFKDTAFQALLEREKFNYLIIILNPFEGVVPAFERPDCLEKVIFLYEDSLATPSIATAVPPHLIEAHTAYYKADNKK